MEKKVLVEAGKKLSQEFLNFVNKAVSPYHAVFESKQILLSNGFQEISEQDTWALKSGGKYFFTRNTTTLVAFTVGNKYQPGNGFNVVGAHTDSPTLKLAPFSKLSKGEHIQSHVSTYGGGLWHTWFDRDLTLAGRIIYKNDKGELDQTLYHHETPLLKIPSLCIHLETADERQAFKFNKETQLRPIFSHEVYNQLSDITYEDHKQDIEKQHYAGLLNLISREKQIPLEKIVDFELYFLDAHPAGFFGLNNEYISSPRLDNLFSSYFALAGLVSPQSVNENQNTINMVCLFDHEECGSDSFQGAHSTLLKQTMERIFYVFSHGQSVAADALQASFHRSFVVSADMAHGLHPNYPAKHKEGYSIKMNEGVVIKTNSNQRYTTDAVSSSLLKQICSIGQIPVQEFIVKNDQGCGSTIGPLITSMTGIKGIDIGIAQLSMHSIRETCGIIDSYYYKSLFEIFFREFQDIKHQLFKF